jgi:predicted amino acid dehydrogenase
VKTILIIHSGNEEELATVLFCGQQVQIRRLGCGGDAEYARRLIADHDGQVDAIGLEDMPIHLQLGPAHQQHRLGATLAAASHQTPVVDGAGVRGMLERWGVTLAERAQPGIFSQKRILMVPGLNHDGLAHALGRRGAAIRYADPLIYFGLPDVPGVGSRQTLAQAAGSTLEQLKRASFRLLMPQPATRRAPLAPGAFAWADILAGDMRAIRHYAPDTLQHKTVVVESATEEDLADLRRRGVAIVVDLLSSIVPGADLNTWSAAATEALLVAVRTRIDAPLTEDTYLDMLAGIEWMPDICYLQPHEAGINRFAFVIHPLDISFIHTHPLFRWTRYLPDELVEAVAAYIPPLYLSRITGAQSPTTGQRIEGHLISLGATPRQMLHHDERFTYRRLNQAARLAERKGARIMGLGAFTSVVGDAGITVAHEADIAITSGNSLTVAATLGAAKQAVIKMGKLDLTTGKAMVVGATGSIGAICARLLAQAIYDVALISIEPEKLIDLKRTIEREAPGARVTIGTRTEDLVADCDLVVTATSAFGQRIIDITQCKPGAVICDVARPPDINPAEAALRPDVLVIESGEVLIPGEIDFGYDIGLPPRTAYACLAETALLAMEGRFEDYTLGRNITIERVKEIYHLFKKHQFQLAGLRSFGRYITDEDIVQKRAVADQLRASPKLLMRTKAEAAAQLARIPPMAKGVKSPGSPAAARWVWLAAGLALAGLVVGRRRSNHRVPG